MKLVRKDLRQRNKYRRVGRLLVGKSFFTGRYFQKIRSKKTKKLDPHLEKKCM